MRPIISAIGMAFLLTTAARADEPGGAAGEVERGMDRGGDATEHGLSEAGAATGRALNKAMDKTGKGIGWVLDKTGRGLEKAGEALKGE